MQLTFLAGLAAVAVGVGAQTSISPEQASSVLMVLATALPADVRSYAIASQSAFAAEMSSSLAAGNLPGWYQSMPADVKSILPLLYPAAAEATTTPVVTSTTVSSAVASASAAPTGSNSTSISAVHSATLSGTQTTPTGVTPPESTGAASHAKAAVGAGLAGVAGFLALLAL
ncbi:hypothetical protein C7974DRAFT_61253 [Boeremia exigua]|uniref:uncharacterized protein n=1 Tax=Boeremia exigua TaxID=749465 RepID=UPI001E8DB67C|nr:uncharacterized protein C7974DRAFT_61253 [Boeremia exigua]KAH6615222.1 hypothetical protein C7974DRAFT_61253 [Boeremia exigua]